MARKGVDLISIPGNTSCNVTRLQSTEPFVTNINSATMPQNIFNDTAEAIFSFRSYPFPPTLTFDVAETNKVPIFNTSIPCRPAWKSDRIVSFEHCEFNGRYPGAIWSTIKNARYFGDVQIYLPYLGFTHLELSELFEHLVRVFYSVDLASGETTVYITSDGVIVSAINTKIGDDLFFGNTNAAQQFKQNLATGIQTAAGTVVNLVSGNYVGAGATAAGGVSTIALNQTTQIARGQIGTASTARCGPTVAFIEIECYDPSELGKTTFASLRGRPLERPMQLYELSGYTEFSDVHLNVPNALEDEKAELESLLKSGVIL